MRGGGAVSVVPAEAGTSQPSSSWFVVSLSNHELPWEARPSLPLWGISPGGGERNISLAGLAVVAATAAAATATAPVAAGGGGRLAGGHDGYGAVPALAVTFGADAPDVRERDVDDAAVGGGHGFEADAGAVVDGALGHAPGELAQLALAPLPVLLDVDDDACGAGLTLIEDEVGDELERAERLAAPPNEEAGIVALDVDHRGLARFGGADRGRGVDVEGVEELLDDVKGLGCEAAVVADEANADGGGLGADAEDARASGVKNVDLDFVAADAEFEGCEFDRFLHGLRGSNEALVCRLFHRQAPCPAGLR